jgi:hypothetical protein
MDDDRGCYLTFTEENNGTLYVNWSEKPVDGVSSSSLHCMGPVKSAPHLAPLTSPALHDLQCVCVCMYTVCYMGYVRSVRHSCQSAVTDVRILSPHTYLACHACSPPLHVWANNQAFLYFRPFKAVPAFKFKQNGGRSECGCMSSRLACTNDAGHVQQSPCLGQSCAPHTAATQSGACTRRRTLTAATQSGACTRRRTLTTTVVSLRRRASVS